MFDEELQCPYCQKCLGKSYGSDKTCYSKVLKSPPKSQEAKERSFQTKCHRCSKLVYIVLGFRD